MYSSTSSQPWTQMAVSDHFHAPVALPTQRDPGTQAGLHALETNTRQATHV